MGVKGFAKGHKQVREDTTSNHRGGLPTEKLKCISGQQTEECAALAILHLNPFCRLTHDEIISPCGSMGILPLM